MEKSISIITKTLTNNSVSSDKIDFIIDFVTENASLLSEAYEMEKAGE